MLDEFNIIIAGVGGQGLITLLKILAEATLIEGRDVKTSELHGLSQREGSVQTHIRFALRQAQGKVYSPLVGKGRADLVFGLEACEVLRISDFVNKNTKILVDKKFIPYLGGPSERTVFEALEEIPAKIYFIEASRICQKEFKKEVLAGVYLLGFALKKPLIPLKAGSVLKAIKKAIPKDYFEMNKKTLLLGQKHAQ